MGFFSHSNADGRFNNGQTYSDEVVLLPLPDEVEACDISTLTIWCDPFNSFFNQVTLGRDVFVSVCMSYYVAI